MTPAGAEASARSRDGARRAPRRLVLPLLAALGLATLLGGAAYGAARYAGEVLTSGSRLRLLLGPPDAAAEAGVVLGPAQLLPARAGGLPACTVSYRRGKTSHSTAIHGGAIVELLDDGRFSLQQSERIRFARDPEGTAGAAAERAVRARLDLPEPHDATIRCVSPSEVVYVEGCVSSADPTRLAACPGDEAVWLAAGRTPAPLVQQRASEAIGWLGLCLASFSLLAAAVWWRGAFLRPVVARLAAHARETAHDEPPRDMLGYAFAATLVAFGILALAFRGRSGHYAVSMAVVLAVALFLVYLVRTRRRRLTDALSVVRRLQTVRLADAGMERSELAVRVPTDAPRVEAPAGRGEPAFVQLTISELVSVRSKKGSNSIVEQVRARLVHPKWLPIEDASGTAFLDMEGCALDAPAERSITTTRQPALPAWAGRILQKPIEPADNHRCFVVAWSKLEPGDPLLVYGSVAPVRAAELPAATEAPAGYRGAPQRLGVQGKTVAFRGEERELQRALQIERRIIVPVSMALALAAAAVVVACIHAATLV